MSDDTKHVAVMANRDITEALRMASGLTLLDDVVEISVIGELERNDANNEQLEALEFSDITVNENADSAGLDTLLDQLCRADVVYCI